MRARSHGRQTGTAGWWSGMQAAMQMVSFIENEFDFEISNDELNLDNFKSISSILAFIDSKSE